MSVIYECNRCKKRFRNPDLNEINFDISVEIRKQGSKDFYVHHDNLCTSCLYILEKGICAVLDMFSSIDNEQKKDE